MRRFLPLLVTLFVFLAGESIAARPRLFFRARPHMHWAAPHMHRVAPTYQQTRQYLNWHYPKYIGGFHANYFRDLGVPPGDIGLRGNGIYIAPW